MVNKNSISEKTVYTKKIESEKAIEQKLVDLVNLNNGICIKLLCNHILGLPDRLCLFPTGKLVFIELKTTGKKPRKIQISVHNKLRQLGFRVEVIDSIEGVIDIVNNIMLQK